MKENIEDIIQREYSYPEQNDENIQHKIYKKKEFYNNRVRERETFDNYDEIKEHRDKICGGPAKSHSYQDLLSNFINPGTPYKGLIVMHGLGSGKTRTAINIAENFIPQCQRYRTKIVVLIPGPVLKENWKRELLKSTGEKYMKYIDKSQYIGVEEKEKLQKNAMSIILQYYKFMSYKSFYKHVLGEKIIDKKISEETGKVKNVYRKNENGNFERDESADKIHNLNNTILIVDEAHQITGNAYGDAVKYIIDNSMNLRVLFLTATPMKNLADDFVKLINLLRPINSQMERDKIFSQHKNYQMELKKNGEEYFKQMTMGYVSYVKGGDPLTYATRVDVGEIPKGLHFTKVTQCKMNDFQKKVYDETIDEQKKEIDEIVDADETEDVDVKDVLDRKSESICNFVFPALSSDKSKIVGLYGREGIMTIKNQIKENPSLLNKKLADFLNTQENDLINITNDNHTITGKIFKHKYLKHFSTKFHRALTNLNELVWGKKGCKTAFVYSNLVKVGIEMFQEVLLQNGYLEYQEDQQNYQINSDTICYFCGNKYSEHNDVISDNNDNTNTKENIPNHFFHPATFITITGKASDDSIDSIPEEKLKIKDTVFNNIKNKDGKHIKFILGSKVMNEGVSLENVGEVHILDVYYNLGKVDQAIGRGIRFCSHYKIMDENNQFPEVKVYKYVVSLDNSTLSTEEDLYRKAELKYILVKKVERMIKEVAVDCALNYNANIFSEDLKKYANCENEGEFKCPATCDYMKCNFKCENEKLNLDYYDPEKILYKKISKKDLDTTTFSHDLSRNEINHTKELIKNMYIMNYFYTLEDIVKNIKEMYEKEKREMFDEFFVYKALDELIPITENDFNNFKDTITDKYNRHGYLIYRGKTYVFQPMDFDENVPLYYRSTHDSKISFGLSIYNYLKMSDQLQSHIDMKFKNSDEINENSTFYDFESIMEYYDVRDEYDIVGFIDKELNRGKNKSVEDINDIFKIREKRAKILEKKRATGIPTLKGAVCMNAKDKGYLVKIAKKLDIELPNKKTRQSICIDIEKKMLLLEKYGTDKDKNKMTYIMIPSNHPTYPFPYNLEDRVGIISEKIINGIKINSNIKIEKIKKTSGEEKNYPSYILNVLCKEKLKDKTDIEVISDVAKKYKINKVKVIKENKEWELLIE